MLNEFFLLLCYSSSVYLAFGMAFTHAWFLTARMGHLENISSQYEPRL